MPLTTRTLADSSLATVFEDTHTDGAGKVIAVAIRTVDKPNTPGANAETLRSRAVAALAANATFIATAKPGTAAAQASAAYDQTVRLTKECTSLIRLFLGLLADVSDTA